MDDLLTAPMLALLAVFAAGLLAWTVALVLAAVGLVHGLVRAYRWLRPSWAVDELPPDEQPDSGLWLACHSPRCGHMQTLHDVSAEGASVCRACGTTGARA